ncbi:MAG TPA: ATP-NAD kinase family protein [Syntrophomonadaceae bacterium]|nr:ATP-NAD kinase family protein [Syntrophomonadaceae bacterium]HQA07231.1 ATP-NAD kinase family protein [Syntrophomonadaceae bacterium]HQE22420.1 ATP-NAD kinase family protein [Syntrophomonadaceae bacterium]
MKRLGLLVNPIAGMGGKAGLKGSDGTETVEKALKLGIEPESPRRAVEALKVLLPIKEEIQIITYPAEMGENEAREAGFEPVVVGSINSGRTSREDTLRAVEDMLNMDIDLLLFAGGDGTARDVFEVVNTRIPVLGIPAGVKIHSGVYAVNPRSAGQAALLYLQGKSGSLTEAEVMDIDEDAFRQGTVKASLFGYMLIPEDKRHMQNTKAGSRSGSADLSGIGRRIAASMEEDVLYIIGPGTTTRVIMEQLNLPNTLLGVDVVLNKKLLAADVNEKQLYQIIDGKRAKIIVTVIGGQGHFLGRGNQQISPRIIRKVGKENIIVIAAQEKLIALQPASLLVDTGDNQLDQELSGYIQVITGEHDSMVLPVRS